MTKEEKIEAIYEKVGTPIFMGNEYCGFDFCMVGYILDYLGDLKTEEIINNELQLLEIHKWWDGGNFFEIRDLAYCLDSILENVIEIKLNKLWKEKRKPIEKQSEECIDYVFNLLPKE